MLKVACMAFLVSCDCTCYVWLFPVYF